MTSVQSVLRPFLCIIGAAMLLAVPALAQDRLPLTTDSKAAATYLNDARDHLNNVEIVAAREAADKALEKDPNFAVALTIRAMVSENFADGKSYMDKAQSMTSDVSKGERLFIESVAARRAGDMKKMTEAVMALGEMYPKDPDVLFMVGQMHFGMRNEDKVKTTFNKLLEIDPKYDAAYNLLGYRAMNRGNFDEAEKMFKKYVELRPDAPNPYDSLAEYYLKVGEFDKAVENYMAAYEADPRYIDAWTRAGLVMAMNGDVEGGEAEIRKALAKAPDSQSKTAAYDALANAALLNDDVERALSVFDEASLWATTAAPERVSYFKMGEGWVLYEYGRRSEAEEVHKEIQALLDDDEMISDDLRPYVASRATMAEALLAIENGDMETAEQAIQEFKAYGTKSGAPGDVEILHELKGAMAHKQGNYEEALDHFAKAGDDPYVFYRAGKTCKEMGDMKQARAYFEKAAKANQPTRSFALIRNRAMQEM